MRLLAIAALSATACLAQAPFVTVPAGTKIPLSLASPLSTKTARVGDAVRAQTAFPVAVGANVAIPTGTYVEGVIDKVRQRGHNAGFDVHFTRMLFANGYTVPLSGSTTAPLVAGLDVPELPDATAPGMAEGFQPSLAPTLTQPSLPGPKIGLFVGIAAAGTALMVAAILFGRHSGGGLYLDAGFALEMVLSMPLPLEPSKLPTSP
jgi:hypothetical protein